MVKFRVTFETVSFSGDLSSPFTSHLEKPIDIDVDNRYMEDEAIRKAWNIYIERHKFTFENPHSYRLCNKINCKLIENFKYKVNVLNPSGEDDTISKFKYKKDALDFYSLKTSQSSQKNDANVYYLA